MANAGLMPDRDQQVVACLERELVDYLDRYGKAYHVRAEDLILATLRVAARGIAMNLTGDDDEMLPQAIDAARDYLKANITVMRLAVNQMRDAAKGEEWKDWPVEEGHV